MSIASGMPSNSVSSPKYIGLGVAEAIIQSFEVPHSTKCNPEKHQHCQANWEDQWFKKISFRLLDPDDMLCPAFLVAALENIKHHDMVPECRKLKLVWLAQNEGQLLGFLDRIQTGVLSSLTNYFMTDPDAPLEYSSDLA
ncbi:hypothetical protein C8J56DRAFT_898473 [Mycena floridula]|nr:hypothetical protein C8J56DRAFT_898473 [Mycena floridula]